MFYVYSPDGRVFSGPMEKLRRVERSNKTTQFKALQEQDQWSEPDDTVERYTVSERAVSEYQSMLKQSSAKEAVYHAYQIMTQPVITLQSDQTWAEAYQLFQHNSHQLIPVLNNYQQLVASLSRQWFYHTLLTTPSIIDSDQKVFDLIPEHLRQVVSADPVTDVRRIAKVLTDQQLEALPVVESSHRLVGIVSRTDILKCVMADPPLSLWC